MYLKIAAAAFTTLLLGTAANAAPLVTNGDFASSTYSVNHQFGTGGSVPGPAQGVDGWTGDAGYNLYFTSAGSSTTQSAVSQYGGGNEKLYGVAPGSTLPSSPTGGSFVALDGDTNVGGGGGISQQISGLTIGDTYHLTFSYGAGQLQSRNGATTERLAVSLGGQTFTTPTIGNPAGSFTGWFSQSFDYTATATSELLSFLSIGTPSGLPPIATLDGVSLNVPEPMSIALFGVGLVGLGLMYRRGRRTV